jgi:glycosyltransferase involved in cell wall biosynthesis
MPGVLGPAPAVSVLLAAHNAAPSLAETLASLEAQTLPDWEAIVVDDGSDDDTPRILEGWLHREPRLVVLRQENRGLTRSLNRALALARGAYLARIDCGDTAHPERLARQKDFLDAHPDHVAVGSRVLWVTPEGWPVGVHDCRLAHDEIDGAHIEGLPGQLPHAASMLRRTAVIATGSYDESFVVAQDYDLFLRLGEVGRLANLDSPLTRCRLDLGSVSSRRRDEQVRWAGEAVARARARRGLPPLTTLPSLWAPRTAGDLLRKWVQQAILSRNYTTARRYAWRLCRSDPGSAAVRLLVRAAVEELKATSRGLGSRAGVARKA